MSAYLGTLPVSIKQAIYRNHSTVDLIVRGTSVLNSVFDPVTLFSDGEQGIFLDPSDLSTMSQDAAGTIPVTKDGDPIGLMLDKSKGLELGNELSNGYEVGFIRQDSTDETLGTNASIQPVTTNWLPVTGIKTIKIDWVNGAEPSRSRVQVRVGGTIQIIANYNGEDAPKKLIHLPVGATEIRIYFSSDSNTARELTVRELKGHHAMQTVSAARPVYKTDSTNTWLDYDKTDDTMFVGLPTMVATVIKATDEGVSTDYPISLTAGDYPITATSELGRDYGYLIINKELSVSEITQVTNYFNAKRG